LYAAQAISQIDAEIAEKGHLWMETNSLRSRLMNPSEGANIYTAFQK
jgi:hypothetical protein